MLKPAFRKKRNYLAALLSEWISPLLKCFAACQSRRPSVPTARWKRALILGDHHIGDVLYRSGSLEALKRGLPECDFYYLASEASLPALETCPALKGVLPYCQFDSRLKLTRDALVSLRKLDFDAAICSNAVHYYQDLRLALKLGIPSRAAFTFKGFSAWVTHPIEIHYPDSYPAYFRSMVAQLTGQSPGWDLRPRLWPTENDVKAASVYWQKKGFEPDKPVIACFMTSRQPSGVWPLSSFARTLQLLGERRRVQVLLCGAVGDLPLLQKVSAEFHLPCVINAGELNLRSLTVLLSFCDAVLSTDSGPRHLANASGVPVVFVRNIAVNKVETGAYLVTEYDIATNAEFVIPAAQAEVLRATTPEMGAEKLNEILKLRRDFIGRVAPG